MTIVEKVLELLSVDAGVIAFVTPDRIKPPGDWQRLARPYIVHFPVALRPIYTHGTEKQGLQVWDVYQVSCFANSYSEARTVAEAVKTRLSGHHDGCHFFIVGEFTDYEPDVNIHQIGIEFRVSESLAA